eukprot:TRINITY_DN1889_c0_g1_i2.p1 TRINITY_DN1889_c0_g1~~TRINITY_DN1889_c0_g1_i2.p1  ORF type:complete len:277 (+),score=89.23 TRINITY_DN1889_c0_g1_i2:33-833(+)
MNIQFEHLMDQVQHAFGGGERKVIPDPRTEGWPMMDAQQMLLACAGYLAFIVIGKLVMSFLPKMELKSLRTVHNGLLTVFNLYLVIELLRQAAATGWYAPLVTGDAGLGMAAALYLFYMSKYWEFLDTVIMIFRKSFDQVSFLHVYHHCSVVLMWWFNVRYYPGGEAWPSAWLNSFVHVWMYLYYFLSTLGIQPWWKKYLTQLQITQLFLFVIQGIALSFTGHKDFRFIGVVNGGYALTLFLLFVNFYIKSYSKGARAAKDKQKKQ